MLCITLFYYTTILCDAMCVRMNGTCICTCIYIHISVLHGMAWHRMVRHVCTCVYVRNHVCFYAIRHVAVYEYTLHACMQHVCMHARMRTLAHARTHTQTYMYIYIYILRVCVCVKMCLFKHEHTVYRISECMQICKYEDLHICIHIYIYVETPIHTYLYMYVHTCA